MLPWLRISLFEEKGWASQLHKRKRDVVKGTDDEAKDYNKICHSQPLRNLPLDLRSLLVHSLGRLPSKQ
jgi:hypothetical protein